MRNLGLGFALGLVVGILLAIIVKAIALIILIGLAVVGVFAIYVVITKKSEPNKGG